MRVLRMAVAGAVPVVGILAALCGPGGPVCAQEPSEAAQLLDAGLKAFEEGKLDEAADLFVRAVGKNPSSREAFDWLDRVGFYKAYRALRLSLREEAGKPGEDVARAIGFLLRLSKSEARERSADAARIGKVVDEVLASRDMGDEYRLMVRAASVHGRYLVPKLVPLLESTEMGRRTKAIRFLRFIGLDAVMPLVVAADSEDPVIRQNVAATLGHIGHDLALATLKALFEKDPDAQVRERAARAIREITGGDPEDLPSAAECYRRDAIRTIQGRNDLPRFFYEPRVWYLRDGELSSRKVAAFQLRGMIADAFLRKALALDPGALETHRLLVANLAEEVALYRATRAHLEKAQPEGAEPLLALLKTQETAVERMTHQITFSSPVVLDAALDFALEAKLEDGAIALLQEIAGLELSRTVLPAVAQALVDENRRVRFEAAVCLAYQDPSLDFPNKPKVVENLKDGLVQSGARSALLIVGNRDTAALFASYLRDLNFIPFVAADEYAGLLRAQEFPPKDLVILDTDLREKLVPEMVHLLRVSYQTKASPILVVSHDADVAKNKARYDAPDHKVYVVSTKIPKVSLRDDVLAPLFQTQDDVRAEAVRIAARAARAILFLTERATAFSVEACEEALLAVLERRPDEIRIPAVRAAGKLGSEDALPRLLAIFNNRQENSVDLREAALKAIGDTLERSGRAVGSVEGLLAALHDGLKDEDARIRRAAAQALGKGELAPGARWKAEDWPELEPFPAE